MSKSMKNRKMSDQIKTQHGTIGILMAECEQLRRELAQAKAELGAWHSAFGTTQLSHALAAYEKAKAENQRLTEQLESHAWEVSPAMAQAKIDQLQADNARLAAQLFFVRADWCLIYNKHSANECLSKDCPFCRIETALQSIPNPGCLADLAQAKADAKHWMEGKLLKNDAYIRLQEELAQARAENARLTGQLQDAHADLNAVKCGHSTPKEARLERDLAQAKAEIERLTGQLASANERAVNIAYSEFALRDLLAPTIELFASMQDSGCSRRVQEELSRLRSILTSSSKSDTNTP